MTPTGMAVFIFVLCLIVGLIFLGLAQGSTTLIIIQPFPRVHLVSPLRSTLTQLKEEAEQLIFYGRLLRSGHKISLSSFGQKSVLEIDSFRGYQEMKSKVELQYGVKPPEEVLYTKIDGKSFVLRASFTYKNNMVIYRPRIVLNEGGQLLNSYNDVAQAVWTVLSGERVLVAGAVEPRYLEAMKMLAQKYFIEVVNEK